MRLNGWRRAALGLLLVAVGLLAPAEEPKLNPALPLVHIDHGPNSAAAQQSHYVVLVSLDGFRWDYAERDHATHLLAIARQGVWAPQGMLPSFPSLTFPNHLTIVTGLYPEHHGIVANSFYDPARKARYAIRDQQAVTDGSWYSGVPLWSLAEGQGMRTACLYWPGSEAEIAAHRPTWYARFDSRTQATAAVEQARIDDAAALLKLPPEERPHLITVYYSEPDQEGHKYGPDAPETRAAVLKMDSIVAKLKVALDKTHLPIDLIVVSDHGMARVEGPWVTLDAFANLKDFETSGQLLYANNEQDRQRAYNQLKRVSSQFMVYRLKFVPPGLHANENSRMGDPVVIATGPFAIRAEAPASDHPDSPPNAGAHGYDPKLLPEMKASFFAEGPDIVRGKTVKPFENVNLYPWMAHILGLQPAKNDGNLNILSGTLRDNGGPARQDQREQGKE